VSLVRVIAVDAHEGPVHVAEEDALYFTTVPRGAAREVSIMRLALDGHRFPLESDRVSVVRAAANVANGMALDHDGRLVVCEQAPAAITRVDRATGAAQTAVDAFDGRPLNSPNDVVVKRDGTIWFTDPSYGHMQGFRPPPRLGDDVYRHDPRSGVTTCVADGFDKPNGLAFSPNEDVLYVGDSGEPCHVLAFDVVDGRRLTHRRRFAAIAPGFPDGLKVDPAGRVYVSSGSGVQVFDPRGERVDEIPLPGAVNFTFGGGVLFITTDDAIWAAIDQPAKGA
jgi:gluconolactonase